MAFKLPSITSAIPRDLRAFCDRVREALNAQGNDRIITRRDLIATGVVVAGPGNTLSPPPDIKFGTPPAPTGLSASGAIANIILTWDAPNYAGHSHTEVYVADTNTFTSRVKLADAPGSVYSHSVGSATTKYYWIRFVNVVDVPGPFNSTTGVSGTTGSDPAYLLGVLTGSITSSELSTALNTEITTNTTEITNVRNLYTVKMDNNGFLTGFGLMSTLADGGVATSDFFTNVNRFAVTAPMTTMPLWASGTAYSVGQSVRISGTTTKILVCKVAGTSGGSAPSISGAIGSIVTDNTVEWQISSSVPFAVLSTSLTANGVTLAPGVYIDGASIVNATIGSAQIGLATIDDARITDLNATKINAGFLSAARIQAGSIDANKVSFTVVGTNNVVGTINSSTEGIRISGTKIRIDGNVTFSAGYDPTTKIASGGAATDINNNVTTISGGKITTGSIDANRLNVSQLSAITSDLGSATAGSVAIGSGGNISGTPPTPGGYTLPPSASPSGGRFLVNTSGYTYVDTLACYGHGFFGTLSGFAGVTSPVIFGENTTSNANAHAIKAEIPGGSSGYAFYTDQDAYIGGTSYPFTAGHRGVIAKNTVIEQGDIVQDVEIVCTNNFSDTVFRVAPSTQTTNVAIGVFVRVRDYPSEKFAAMTEAKYLALQTTDDLCSFNALGEGQINVCGEGGNIEAGDLIVTSSLPGKGMKQSDDIVRAVTVAKARESVTFASPTEVKQIACIYLCG